MAVSKNSKTKNGKSQKRQKVMFVVSTHWDREWYMPFQDFRYRLVKLMDEVLDVLESDERFTCFQMDGQSSPILDYLEIRPENEERIKNLAAAGRLAVGPWLTMPDEFIVSGESLVRNIQEGLRIASQFGEPSRAGFICDIFGHNSQIPQIFNDFGMKSAFLWRGINEENSGPYFRWSSPDGSELACYRLGPGIGYCNFPIRARNPQDHSEEFDINVMAGRVKEYLKFQVERCGSMPIILFDGADHLEIEPRTGELVELLNADKSLKKYQFEIATLDSYGAELLKNKSKIKKKLSGELREPRRPIKTDENWMIPGVLSSRIPLKQANARCETLMTLWAEPFSRFAVASGLQYPQGFLREAWKNILLNHAHDSICGCSIDKVHKDMEYRFDQAELIGKRLKKAALDSIAESVARGMKKKYAKKMPDEIIVLYNPTSREINEPVDFTVTLPENTPVFNEFFGFEPKPGFRLKDQSGKEIEYQRISQTSRDPELVVNYRKFTHSRLTWNVDVTARVKIPAFGYTALKLETASEPTRQGGMGLTTGPVSAENEFLAIEFEGSGLLKLKDKRNGQVYEKLLMLQDNADIGDGWYHGQAVSDELHYSSAANASIACIADGPEMTTFRIELHWPLPEKFDFEEMSRGDGRKDLRVNHEVTLRAGCDRVEVRTTVFNQIKDHRLRVIFPSGAKADTYLADSPFDVIQRPIALHKDHHTWAELEVDTKPQQSWTAVVDKKRGLAVVSDGLPESAVCDWPERPIALTLLRGFKKTVMTKGEPGGQIQGRHEFNYWIMPLSGGPDFTELCAAGQKLAAGISTVQPELVNITNNPEVPAKLKKFGRGPVLPESGSFINVKGPVVITAVRAGDDDSTIIRFFNPENKSAKCEVSLFEKIGKAWLCNLEEKALEKLPVSSGKLKMNVDPKKIVTIKLIKG